ncbi:ribulose-phosphate 3-epimerase [Spiroplasma culicicola]|uniref:Ribulose-phosphate 3-epimerase n=1 Tax=Spiroplasma culicicola AES-1 TaxID=1276246 RepID=W6A890_9MOLU|nr:ribulose-phosphate 3-epimerase [Spiroplasma culicicola]AHI53192.1 ribulose-phosphate 3-epimerase [Spiroplasma culicicola AES-1]
MEKFIVAPSILTANFVNLKNDLDILKDANIKWIHYDVMDYNFVPNLSFGPKILKDITDNYDFKIDAHLMVKINNLSVEEYLKPFIEAKVAQITLHFEAIDEEQFVQFKEVCQKNNIICSLAINPDTSIEAIQDKLKDLQNVLVMTVYPGFGGQSYIPEAGEKIKQLVEIREAKNLDYSIEVDGGINDATYRLVQNHGVDMIVAGSYLVGVDAELVKERVFKLENKILDCCLPK